MAKRTVCDGGEPCTLFQRAIGLILHLVEVPSGTAFDMRVVAKNSTTHENEVHMQVRLEYCPFCGTRIDPADWIDRRRRR